VVFKTTARLRSLAAAAFLSPEQKQPSAGLQNGFLGRVWDAAIKSDEKEKHTYDLSAKGSPPLGSIVEPAECRTPGH